MPLTFDLSIEELKTYQGKNPRPEAFDAFWDKSLSEMRALDGQVELTPAEFETSVAECFHLYFTGVGGARVTCQAAAPCKSHPSPSRRPAVPWVHGRLRRLV